MQKMLQGIIVPFFQPYVGLLLSILCKLQDADLQKVSVHSLDVCICVWEPAHEKIVGFEVGAYYEHVYVRRMGNVNLF